MAQPADTALPGIGVGPQGGTMQTLIAEHNKLVAVLRILTAKLDLDAGVTDVNYAALVTAVDAATSPAKLTLP